MKNLKNFKDTAVNYGQTSETSKKHDVNLKSNSSLYFQIGLILCLLATYGLFEMKFKYEISTFITEIPYEDDPFYMPEVTITADAPKPEPVAKKVAMLTDKPPIVKPDNFVDPNPVVIETIETLPPVDVPNPTKKGPDKVTPTQPSTFSMIDVERVPIFPGCESANNNEERMACMSEKLTKLIQKKFNTDLASDLGLFGVQKIYVQFKIDDQGNVTDIKSRSPYSQLEKEAERVVSKIPVMTPGMQRNTPVSVIYYLPIAFQVH